MWLKVYVDGLINYHVVICRKMVTNVAKLCTTHNFRHEVMTSTAEQETRSIWYKLYIEHLYIYTVLKWYKYMQIIIGFKNF